MVRGLDVFREYFADHADQFVLIGGTAATLAMEDAGLEFRATKDLDIVLHIEALNAAFGEVFWKFVEEGRYEIRQASNTGRPVFYRFQKPADERFPIMLELFCRAPDGIKLAEGSHLTPIPLEEAVASLSAILLDDEYYAFICEGLFDAADRYRFLNRRRVATSYRQRDDHRPIMEAVLARDTDRAVRLLDQHFRRTQENGSAELRQLLGRKLHRRAA